MRVSSINDDITWLCTTFCDDGLDEGVDSLACLEGFGERSNGLGRVGYLTWTRSIIRRGFLSLDTNSSRVCAPMMDLPLASLLRKRSTVASQALTKLEMSPKIPTFGYCTIEGANSEAMV